MSGLIANDGCVPRGGFPRILLYQKFMAMAGLPVPQGLSDDEVLRRVQYLVRERMLLAYIVWSETRMTRVAPFGSPVEEEPPPSYLNEHRMLREPLPPVPDLVCWPMHLQMRRSLTGR